MDAANYTDVLSIGRKIEKVRQFRRMTQTDLGEVLGISKQAVSNGAIKKIDDERLHAIAKALDVNTDAIKNLSEDVAFNIIVNTYHNHSSSVNYQFNPIEIIAQLYDERIMLYERILKEKDALIEKLMK